MKLYRFMSTTECYKIYKGETIENITDHSSLRGSASTAKGFCFGIGDEEQAKKDFRRLIGIVDMDALMVFALKPESESRFTPCQGKYIDYDKIYSDGDTLFDYPLGMEPSCMFDEYCTTSYSSEDFEDFNAYNLLVDINKYPGKDCLELKRLVFSSNENQ